MHIDNFLSIFSYVCLQRGSHLGFGGAGPAGAIELCISIVKSSVSVRNPDIVFFARATVQLNG